jgi:hypothetical protein
MLLSLAVCIAPLLVGPICLQAQVSAPAPDGSLTIDSPRPLRNATAILGSRYGKPVTFEEPVWVWQGDLGVRNDSPRFFLPGGLSPEQTATMEAAAQKMLDAYYSQNNDVTRFRGARFRVEKSRLGLHIVPDQFHGVNGDLVPATSILDAHVTVPAAVRMASEHFEAICDAVKAATGVKLDPPLRWMDSFYAANGIVTPRDAALLPASEKEQYSFLWGTSEVTAREALLRLLDGSATTLSWQMLCEHSAQPGDRFCVLNVSPLLTRVTGEDGKMQLGPGAVEFDRVVKPPVRIR